MKKILPLLICRLVYEMQKDKYNENSSLHLIIDEAHNILSDSSVRESDEWKEYRLEIFEEIIKEGRKFGTFMTISSQRSSDISPTIISQIHNFFLHRLVNNNDLFAIDKTVSFLDRVSKDWLPVLPTGSCIFTGTAINFPVQIKVDELIHKPKSRTIELTTIW